MADHHFHRNVAQIRYNRKGKKQTIIPAEKKTRCKFSLSDIVDIMESVRPPRTKQAIPEPMTGICSLETLCFFPSRKSITLLFLKPYLWHWEASNAKYGKNMHTSKQSCLFFYKMMVQIYKNER